MVEWKKIWQVTTWDKSFNGVEKHMQPKIIKYHYYLANELSELERDNGDIRILYTTDRIAFANISDVEKYVSEGEVVTIPWGGNVSVKYYKGKFITADNRIATSNDTKILNNKFLYYWMLSQKDLIGSFYRGAGIKHPSMLSVLNMDIPVPSLSEQSRIVSILDTFTDSIDNLKQQIEHRRKQYEHYRSQLLDHEGKEGVEKKTLGEVCDFQNGFSFKSELFKPCGQPIIRITNITNNGIDLTDCKYFDLEDYKGSNLKNYQIVKKDILIAMSGATTGKIGMYRFDDIAYMNQRVGKFIPHKGILTIDYLYHYLLSKTKSIYVMAGGGAQPNLSSNKLLKELILPIPSLKEQSRIASILDTFEQSIANLEQQLEMRQKQYEFYRNKLLTFE